MNWIPISTAAWLGILTAISPCPLATNIAAISFVSKNIQKKRDTLLSGMLYTSGRTFAYLILGFVISLGLGSTGAISRFLQTYMNEILGPLMIVIGMILTGIAGSKARLNLVGDKLQDKAEKNGLFYAFPLGFLFALSFCPVSAGLFFGSMVPLAIEQNSKFIIPIIYGIGTSIPVVIFAFIIAFASQHLSSSFAKLSKIEKYLRNITGIIFILAGIYYCLTHNFELTLF